MCRRRSQLNVYFLLSEVLELPLCLLDLNFELCVFYSQEYRLLLCFSNRNRGNCVSKVGIRLLCFRNFKSLRYCLLELIVCD